MGFDTEITQLTEGKIILDAAGRCHMEILPQFCESRAAVLVGHPSTVYHVNDFGALTSCFLPPDWPQMGRESLFGMVPGSAKITDRTQVPYGQLMT